jgi:predicted enzyme related to lactoylglutathione lyase
MPDVEQFAPGTPSWVDVTAPDSDAAAAFYSALFGWDATEPGPVEETGGYRMFQLRGRSVAGLGPTREGALPPLWTTYVTVADADASVAAIKDAGGTVFMEPMDVLQAGRMAAAADPQGAFFCIWQPVEHIGSEIVNEPGTLIWNELATTDTDAAKAFYGAVFGWTSEDMTGEDGMSYTRWGLDGKGVGGMMAMGDDYPAGVPPNWLAYFAVADCAAAVARVVELGGSIQLEPMTISMGTFAVLADPNRAVFAVIELAPEMLS